MNASDEVAVTVRLAIWDVAGKVREYLAEQTAEEEGDIPSARALNFLDLYLVSADFQEETRQVYSVAVPFSSFSSSVPYGKTRDKLRWNWRKIILCEPPEI